MLVLIKHNIIQRNKASVEIAYPTECILISDAKLWADKE